MFGMGWGVIFWVIVLVVVIWAVIRLTPRRPTGEDLRTPPPETAKEILDKRYARGEIDEEEYKRRKKELGF